MALSLSKLFQHLIVILWFGYRRVINNHIQVLSAPSTTLGDERLGTSPGFTRYQIAAWQGRGFAIKSGRDFYWS
jgi:hypothetical protein